MTDDQIKHMVDRFLGWRLPENFSPDAGISFARTFNNHLPQPMKHEPIGTNLFDASQAEQMVRYMVEGLPANIERLEKVNEALVSRLEDCLTSELTQQYGRHKGLHETDCSSVQDYLRPVPCDCAWGKLADALRMAKEPA